MGHLPIIVIRGRLDGEKKNVLDQDLYQCHNSLIKILMATFIV